jgi:hypothetical protein
MSRFIFSLAFIAVVSFGLYSLLGQRLPPGDREFPRFPQSGPFGQTPRRPARPDPTRPERADGYIERGLEFIADRLSAAGLHVVNVHRAETFYAHASIGVSDTAESQRAMKLICSDPEFLAQMREADVATFGVGSSTHREMSGGWISGNSSAPVSIEPDNTCGRNAEAIWKEMRR